MAIQWTWSILFFHNPSVSRKSWFTDIDIARPVIKVISRLASNRYYLKHPMIRVNIDDTLQSMRPLRNCWSCFIHLTPSPSSKFTFKPFTQFRIRRTIRLKNYYFIGLLRHYYHISLLQIHWTFYPVSRSPYTHKSTPFINIVKQSSITQSMYHNSWIIPLKKN